MKTFYTVTIVTNGLMGFTHLLLRRFCIPKLHPQSSATPLLARSVPCEPQAPPTQS